MKVHNQISRGDLTSALTRAIGVTRVEGGVERFGESLLPVIDLWRRPEWAFLRNEWLWAMRVSSAAVAGEGSMAAITNAVPPSEYIVTVEGVTAQNAVVGGLVHLMLNNRANLASTLTLGNAPQVRETRFWAPGLAPSGANPPAVETRAGSDPTIPNNSILETVGGQATAEFVPFHVPPVILRPGAGIVVQTAANLQGLVACFWGRVRPAYPGELDS